MRQPWNVAVLLIVGAVVIYAAGSQPSRAQSETLPVSSGETVILTFTGGGTQNCAVEEIRGMFARCFAGRQTLTSPEPPAQWVNLAQVEWITKRRPNR